MKFDIKTLITLGTIMMLMGGFYYTTQLRLDVLEREVAAQNTADIDIRTWMTQVDKRINRLNRKLEKQNNTP